MCSLKKIKRTKRYLYLRFKRLHGNPNYVAMGMAVGVFIGITPTLGIHSILSLIFSFILRCSKAAALLANWISNPFTALFIYIADYKIGKFLLRKPDVSLPLEKLSFKTIFSYGSQIVIPLFVSGIILGIATTIPTYFITFY
ncbi:MAG: DUF2062 domain-containing protein, partial [Deltaproteobacteria bacterium]